MVWIDFTEERKPVLGRRNSQCKDAEQGAGLGCAENRQEADKDRKDE